MQKNRIVNSKLKIWQIGRILREIYKNPSIVRIDLSERIKLNKSVVTNMVKYLLDNKWVVNEEAQGKSIPLNLNRNKIFTAGLEIQSNHQKIAVCDIYGELLVSYEWREEIADIGDFLTEFIYPFIESLEYKILALGVGLPGAVDRVNQILMASSQLDIQEPICLSKYSENVEYPVIFENDIRCGAWGILSYEHEKEDFLLIYHNFQIDSRVPNRYKSIIYGSALCLDEHIYEGSHSCATEVSSILQYSGDKIDVEYIEYQDQLDMDSFSKNMEQIFRNYALQNSFLANYLDLGKIYIGGSLEKYKTLVEKIFNYYLIRYSMYPHIQSSRLCYPGFNDFSLARGASGLALENLFQVPEMEQPHFFYDQILRKEI